MSIDSGARRVLSLFGWLLLLVGCNGTTSYLDATGATGRSEGTLGWWLTATASAVVLLVCIAIVAGIARHRGEDQSPLRRREIASGLNWIYIGLGATIVVLLVTFAGTMITLEAAVHPPRTPSLTMDVTAHQWWWEINYSEAGHPERTFTTANEVHLPVGEPIRVRLQTADVIHSFWLPQIAGKTDVIPGQVNEMWVEAEKAGDSRGMCGEYCGLQHANMALAVRAESPAEFARWAAARRAPAAAPSGSDASAGRTVFARSCGACHAVGGTAALGRVGPDLTHLASRSTIGAGALENTPENLARWIHDAPSIKEGARMPAIPLDDADTRSVVAYLRTLQ
ncbi:MAG: cytochrome c oxidase subunit II [Gemmatimonadaceae bacterium]